MKKYILFLGILLFTMPVIADELVLVSNPWPPYIFGKMGSSDVTGITIGQYNKIFKKMKIKVKYMMIPWRRALQEIKEGYADGAIILQQNSERSKYMVFTNIVMVENTFMFYSKRKYPGGMEWKTPLDLVGYRIGLVRGYSYGPIQAMIDTGLPLQIEMVSKETQLLPMLVRGNIDIFPYSEMIAKYAFKLKGIDYVVHASKEVYKAYYRMGISKKSKWKKMIPQFNKILKEVL